MLFIQNLPFNVLTSIELMIWHNASRIYSFRVWLKAIILTKWQFLKIGTYSYLNKQEDHSHFVRLWHCDEVMGDNTLLSFLSLSLSFYFVFIQIQQRKKNREQKRQDKDNRDERKTKHKKIFTSESSLVDRSIWFLFSIKKINRGKLFVKEIFMLQRKIE